MHVHVYMCTCACDKLLHMTHCTLKQVTKLFVTQSCTLFKQVTLINAQVA